MKKIVQLEINNPIMNLNTAFAMDEEYIEKYKEFMRF